MAIVAPTDDHIITASGNGVAGAVLFPKRKLRSCVQSAMYPHRIDAARAMLPYKKHALNKGLCDCSKLEHKISSGHALTRLNLGGLEDLLVGTTGSPGFDRKMGCNWV